MVLCWRGRQKPSKVYINLKTPKKGDGHLLKPWNFEKTHNYQSKPSFTFFIMSSLLMTVAVCVLLSVPVLGKATTLKTGKDGFFDKIPLRQISEKVYSTVSSFLTPTPSKAKQSLSVRLAAEISEGLDYFVMDIAHFLVEVLKLTSLVVKAAIAISLVAIPLYKLGLLAEYRSYFSVIRDHAEAMWNYAVLAIQTKTGEENSKGNESTKISQPYGDGVPHTTQSKELRNGIIAGDRASPSFSQHEDPWGKEVSRGDK